MKTWRYLTLTMLFVLGLAGCNGSAPDAAHAVEEPTAVETESATADKPVETAGAESAAGEPAVAANAKGESSAPSSDAPVAMFRVTAVPHTDDSFLPPFPENVNFFAPPQFATDSPVSVPQLAAAAVGAEPAVRPLLASRDLKVVGFVQVEGQTPRAMLHVNGQLEIVAAGDLLGDLEIVDVTEPSVSIRCADQHLTVGLSGPAISDERLAQDQSTQRRVRRREEFAQAGRPATGEPAARIPAPVDFASLPTVPSAPQVELPQINLPQINLPETPQADAVP